MSSRCPERAVARVVLAIALGVAGVVPAIAAERVLRVCAVPDNLPLSSTQENGFENRIARLLADEIGATLVYAWEPQRRAFVRKTTPPAARTKTIAAVCRTKRCASSPGRDDAGQNRAADAGGSR